MIIDVSKVDQEQFIVTKHLISGDECTFIRTKNIMTEWNEANLHLRSVIVDPEGKIISASYPKFFNFEERPAIFPFSGELNGCSFIEKIDGSTLIVSKYKDSFIIRTRGSIDTIAMDNADEIPELFKKYKLGFIHEGCSFIFEWVSPRNKIVKAYDEPELYLTNIISHRTYELAMQVHLDSIAEGRGWTRPERFEFDTLAELLDTVSKFDTMEGVCLYYDNDQRIRKVKSVWYLKAHAFKSRMNLDTILELYQSWGSPKLEEFQEKIVKEFDYECLTFATPLITTLYSKLLYIHVILNDVKEFAIKNKDLIQKDYAMKVKDTFSGTLSGAAFAIRKNPDINLDSCIKTLVLEK